VSLQETMNQENYQRLRHYYEQFVDFHQNIGEKHNSNVISGIYLLLVNFCVAYVCIHMKMYHKSEI